MAGDLFSSYHPPLPPTTEDDRLARLRLLRSARVGISTYNRLMQEHGSALNALAALPDIATARGMKNYAPCCERQAAAELKAARAFGATQVFVGDALYPDRLAAIHDAPPFFWAVGRLKFLNKPMVALVGARNASSLGTRMARRLAMGLADAGYVVVSGLARGVDAAAHTGALELGTLAVQAGGVDVIYPQENAALAKNLLQKGVRLSEQPMGLQPQARHFPRRNRIISGLAQAVVVVEAAAKSGTLITAAQALDQGRDVCAVPGHPIDARADGCNMLIRDGASLVRSVDDVLDVLESTPTPTPVDPIAPAATHNVIGFAEAPARFEHAAPASAPLRETAALHRQILDRLGPSPIAEDQLTRDLKKPAGAVAPILVEMELDGQILRHPGGLVSRNSP
ncbi:MAG: DNA-processing protein DprA [Pseudomonadota bacterium]